MFPELAADSTAPGRRLVIARAGGLVLLLAGVAVLAVVVIDHETQHSLGNQVAASSKQVPVTTGGTRSPASGPGGAGGTGTSAPTTAHGAHNANGGVATKAAGSAGQGGGAAGGSTSSNPALASSPAVNVAVPANFGPVLRRAWELANPGGVGIKASDVQSTSVGSVFYAEQPAVHTYWAISQFVPSALAESQANTPAGATRLAEFHGVAIFEKAPGHKWAFVGSFSSGSCPGNLPAPVLTAWGLCTVGS